MNTRVRLDRSDVLPMLRMAWQDLRSYALAAVILVVLACVVVAMVALCLVWPLAALAVIFFFVIIPMIVFDVL